MYRGNRLCAQDSCDVRERCKVYYVLLRKCDTWTSRRAAAARWRTRTWQRWITFDRNGITSTRDVYMRASCLWQLSERKPTMEWNWL